MLITALELENFKSYAKEAIPFQPGTNAIVGANGAGKSTLLEAIGFALFDHQETGASLTALLREGAASGRVVVRMVSSQDEREYEVERCFSAKSTTRYRAYDLELGHRILAEGGEEVRAWMRQHLCINSPLALDSLFENTVGVPQGTFTAPFLLSPTQRKAIFDPLLQVEEYRRASDNLQKTTRYLEEQAAEQRGEITRLEERLTDLAGLREEERSLSGAIEELGGRIRELHAQLAQVSQQLEALDQAERRMREADAALAQAETKLVGDKRLWAEAERALAEAQAAQTKVESAKAGHEAYLRAEAELATLEQQRGQRDRLLREQGRLQQAEARLSERLARLSAELAEIEIAASRMVELAPLVEQQVGLEAALSQAEEDLRAFAEARRREQEAGREVNNAEAELSAVRKGLSDASALEQKLSHAQARLDELAQSERTAREARAARLAEVEGLRAQSAALSASRSPRCPICEAELTAEHRAELLARNAQRIAGLEAEAGALRAQIEQGEAESKSLQGELQRGRQHLRTLPTQGRLAEIERHVALRRQAWADAQEEVAALTAAPDRARATKQALAALGDPQREYQRHEDRAAQRQAKEREYAGEQARAAQSGDRLQRLSQELAPYAQLDAALRATQGARVQHQAAHDTYLAYLGMAQGRKAHAARVAQLAGTVREAEQHLAELRRTQQCVTAIYDHERHARMREQANTLQREQAAAFAQIEERRGRLATVRAGLERLEGMQREVGARHRALAELQGLRGLVESVRETLRKAGPYVTQQLVRQISREASAFYSEIMGDHSVRLSWSEDYEVSVDVRGQKRTFRQFSGGEQMGAALALRLALLREVSGIDVAFFDEPTAHLDAERREGLAEKIMQVKGFAQMFVISHDDTFERAAQSYIRIVKDERGSHLEDS